MELQGKAVSPGYAAGPVLRFLRTGPRVREVRLAPEEAEGALARYAQGKAAAAGELERLRDARGGAAEGIARAQLDILRDRVVDKEIVRMIAQERMETLWAVQSVYDKYARMMEGAQNKLFRERAADFEDVKGRLLRCCQGLPEQDLSRLPESVVLFCRELLPSDTANLDRAHVLAIVTEAGGETSHSAILARNYEIPAVLGVNGLLACAHGACAAAVDAVEGRVLLDPDPDTLRSFQARREAYLARSAQDAAWREREPLSADGVRVDVCLNAASDEGLDEALAGTDGVGLLRTEFLYMHQSHMPTEEEQVNAYRKVLQAAAGRPVVLRTLDIGGDKTLDYLPLPKEDNPFLGERAVRLCLRHTDLFQTQLRAALRASVYGPMWIMFPMISSLEDLRAARAQLDAARRALDGAGAAYDPDVRVGVMVEVPSIALLADALVREVDFASIGSNDLIQYLEAADRMNPAVAAYYEGHHPAVYRLIGYVSEQFARAGKPLSVCGELAGDPAQALLLVGLGLRKLSMSAAMAPRVKKALAAHTLPQMEALARRACSAATAAEVRDLLRAERGGKPCPPERS